MIYYGCVRNMVQKFHRIDGGFAWLIVFSTAAIIFIIFGCIKSGGIYLVVLHQQYGFSKADATLVSLTTIGTTFVTSVFGVPLIQWLGFRIVAVAGSIIAFIGVGSSFFVTDPKTLVVTFGALQGLGFGLMFIPATCIVSSYFDKHIAKANGFSLAGGPLGTCLLPTLIEFLIEKYGLHGTYLIMSAIILNAIVFSLLLWEPPVKLTSHQVSKIDYSLKCEEAIPMNAVQDSTIKEDTRNYENTAEANISSNGAEAEAESFLELKEKIIIKPCIAFSKNEELVYQSTVQELPPDETFYQKLVYILSRRIFYVIILNAVAVFFAIIAFNVTIPDYSVQSGTSIRDAAYVISSSAVFDLLSRLVSGFLMDKPYFNLSFSFAMVLAFAGITFSIIATAAKDSFSLLVACGVFYGLCVGLLQIHIPVTITRYLGAKYLPICVSLASLLNGIICFTMSPICQFLLHTYGSYVGVYFICAGLMFVNALIWGFIYVLEKKEYSI